MDFRDYIRILYRRFWLILAVFLITAGGFSAYVLRTKSRFYTATAKISISIQAGDLWAQAKYSEVFPSGQPFSLISREGLLNTVSVYRFAAVFYEAAKLKGTPPKDWSWSGLDWDKVVLPVLGEEERDRLAKDPSYRPVVVRENDQWTVDFKHPRLLGEAEMLKGSVSISRITDKIAIFDIEARAEEPAEALLRANAVALGAREFSHDESVDTLRGATRHFSDRLKLARREVEDARGRLTREMHSEADVTSLEEKQRTLLQEIAVARSQERETRVRTEQLKDQAERLHGAIHLAQTVPSSAAGETPVVQSPLLAEIEQKLLRYSQELAVARRTRTERHPDILKAEEEVAYLQSQRDLELRRLRRARLDGIEREGRDLQIRVKKNEEQLAAVARELQEVTDTLNRSRPVRDELVRTEHEASRIEEELRHIESAEVMQRGYIAFQEDAQEPVSHLTSGLGSWPMWALGGLLLSLGTALLFEMFDTRIRSDYDIRRTLNLPLLATLPLISGRETLLLTKASPRDPISELFSSLATVVRARLEDLGYRSMAILSATKGEGKTTVASNLAVALARKGMRVLLIDADFRLPTLHKIFELPNTHGFSDLLAAAGGPAPSGPATADGEFAIHLGTALPDAGAYIQAGPEANLRILTSGSAVGNRELTLEGDNLRRVLAALKADADLVIFDTPPVMVAADTLGIAQGVDTNIMVVHSGTTERREATWTKHLLNNVGAHMLGAVLNFSATFGNEYYYYYYSYYYRSPQGAERRRKSSHR